MHRNIREKTSVQNLQASAPAFSV